jgi:hypothetical protein
LTTNVLATSEVCCYFWYSISGTLNPPISLATGVGCKCSSCLALTSIDGVDFVRVGNCNIGFFNFCYRQVWNFEILNLFKQNQNFAIIFWEYWKQNRKSTKYFATSQKPSVIPLKFFQKSLVSWYIVNYCKILQFHIKFGKSLKVLRKILLNWLQKIVKYWLDFVNFHSCTEKCPKVGQLSSITLMKVHGIPWRFSGS